MKHYTAFLLIIMLATIMLGFTACSDMMEKLGTISLTIVLDTPDVAVASYRMEGLHDNPNSRFTLHDIVPPRHVLSSLKSGLWTITVTAFDAADMQLGMGSTSVDIREGQIVETTLLVVFDQAVPASSGFTFTAPTRFDSADGRLDGTTAAMEYRLASDPADAPYTACSEGTTILGAGTYLVRYAAAHGLRASEPLSVSVPHYQPIQLTIADPTLNTSKTYDGTLEIVGEVAPGALVGVAGTDSVTVSARATYDNKDATNGKIITVTYTLEGPDAGNYIKPVDKAVAGVIEKKALAISGTTIAATKVYDRSPSVAVTSPGLLAGVIGSDEVTIAATASCSDSNVGSDKPVTITYTLGGRDGGNYQLADNHSEQTSITKAVLTATVEDYSKTYGENNPSYAVSVSGFIPGEDADTAAGYTAPSASSATDATTVIGVYPITIAGGSATNYSFVTSDRGNLTINKATMEGSVSISGTAAYGQVLTAVPSLTNTETPTYQWKCNGVAISGATDTTYTLVTADIRATITVSATATGANYQGTKDSAATPAVAKAAYAMGDVTFNDYSVSYDGNPKSIEITGTLPSGVSVSYSGNGQTNPGTYSVTAHFTGDSTNYLLIPNKTATLTINKAVIKGNLSIAGTPTYGQVLTAVASLTNTETPTYQWKRNGVAISGATGTTYTLVTADIGTAITVTATATGANYQGTKDSAATTAVAKATYAMGGITFSNYAMTYDGNPKSIQITGTLPSGVSVSYSGNGQTNAGAYTVTARFTGNSTNYETIPDITATLTIAKAIMTGSVSITGTPTYGQVLTAVPNLTNTGTPTYQWKRNGVAISGATGTTYTLVSADIGTTITVTATATGANYQGTKESAPPQGGVITPKQLGIQILDLPSNKVYDGTTSATAPTFNLYGKIGSDDVTITATATYDTPAAGTGKRISIVYSLSGPDEGNYLKPTDTLTTASCAIIKKRLTISAPTLETVEKTYDGTTNVLGSITTGTLSGILEGEVVTVGANASYKSANVTYGASGGEFNPITVVYSLSGLNAINYDPPVNQQLWGAIVKKQLSVIGTVFPASKVYDKSSTITITEWGTLSGRIADDDVSLSNVIAYYSGSYSSNVGADKPVTINYAINGTDAYNYYLNNDTSKTASITAAVLTATVGDYTQQYGSAAPTFTVNVTGFVGSDSASNVLGYSAPTATAGTNSSSAAGTYTIRIAGGSAPNYSFNTTDTGTLTIQKPVGAAISGTINGYYPTSNENQMIVNVTGFTPNQTGIEAEIASYGTFIPYYPDFVIDSRGRTVLYLPSPASTTTKIRFRVKETSTHAPGPATEITLAPRPLAIGDFYEGGIVAYISTSTNLAEDTDGLIAAKSDISSTGLPWSNSTTTVVGTSAGYGTGLSNSNRIMNSSGASSFSFAAYNARYYSAGGHNDWFLPSQDELRELWRNQLLIGNFSTSGSYWSSTELGFASPYNGSTVYSLEFFSGAANFATKTWTLLVRPVRYF